MKNIILISVACLALCGCGTLNELKSHLVKYTTVCVKETNVIYVQFPSGVAPLYNADGTLVTCK